MLQLKVLIGEGLGAINTGTPCTVAVEKITTLYHEIFDLGIGSVDEPRLLGHGGVKRED